MPDVKHGLHSGIVRLTSYSTEWKQHFQRERLRLRRYLGTSRHTLEHIGSTAVPGLDAKPILDLALMIPSFKRLPLWIRLLEKAGYVYKGEYGLPGRHFFVRGNPTTQHLHLVSPGCEHWDRWLLFRDYLRANPAEARLYNETKRNLARKFHNNRDAYTKAKTPVITRILSRARKWQAAQQNRRV